MTGSVKVSDSIKELFETVPEVEDDVASQFVSLIESLETSLEQAKISNVVEDQFYEEQVSGLTETIDQLNQTISLYTKQLTEATELNSIKTILNAELETELDLLKAETGQQLTEFLEAKSGDIAIAASHNRVASILEDLKVALGEAGLIKPAIVVSEKDRLVEEFVPSLGSALAESKFKLYVSTLPVSLTETELRPILESYVAKENRPVNKGNGSFSIGTPPSNVLIGSKNSDIDPRVARYLQN